LTLIFPLEIADSTTLEQDATISLHENSLRVDLHGGPIPGVELTDIAPNWLGFRRVVIDIENPSEEPLNLAIIIGDFESSPAPEDRFMTETTLVPGERRRLNFSRQEISAGPTARLMPMDKISEIVLFRTWGEADTFLLHAIWLEK